MTELVSGSSSIQNLIENIGWYKGSPTRIMQATYDFLDEVLQNNVSLVDPTNPFILGLEIGATQAALAINESLLNQRRTYVGLAQTEQDIYRHMTDTEYLGRFAIPGQDSFQFMFELTSLTNAMKPDSLDNSLKAIIPRDSYITVDNYVFTLQYPIIIRKDNNGSFQVTYDLTYPSPISTPSSNIIPVKGRQDSSGTKWLYFEVPIKQMEIKTVIQAVSQSKIFNLDIAIKDQFMYARAFLKSGTSDEWVEMHTTHSDQSFDPSILTAVFNVTTGNLNVTIPYIYNTQGLLIGQVRIDVYTTKGDVTVNMGSYNLDAFTLNFYAIDKVRDLNQYTNVWGSVTRVAFSDQILQGGSDGVSFATLKAKITDYAFGNVQIPITTAQLETLGEQNGFTIVKNSDPLNNRVMLAVRAIPEISVIDTKTNTQKLLSRANAGMIRFSSSLEDLQASDNVYQSLSSNRTILLSNTVFDLVNGVASLVENSEVNNIKAQPVNQMVNSVNNAHYVYTPYYYVFDLQEELLNVRPYDLDHPEAANLSFVRQNATLALAVNVNSYSIEKIPMGYRLTIILVSGQSYKQLNDNQVAVQLRLRNEDGSLSGTINGTQIGIDPDSSERIYQFDIETTYDVNSDHAIEVINAYNTEGAVINNFYVNLDTSVDILHSTNSPLSSGFVADETDALINKAMLPVGSVGNVHETIDITFGVYLEHLWTRFRSFASGEDYKTSPVNVPAYYETNVFKTNPVTGSMLFIDGSGNPYYVPLHNQGDIILDIIEGTVPPTNVIGEDGDYYLNTSTNIFYGPKTAGVWPPSTRYTLQGWGAPSNSIGAVGNYYINKVNGDYYGPKTSGGWPSAPTFTITPEYKYNEGDTLHDNNGDPILINDIKASNDFDILVFDGKLEFVTDSNYINYRAQITTMVTEWITTDILEIDDKVLENTEVRFYPEASLGTTKILLDNVNSIYINSEQVLTVTVIANETVLNDTSVQETMSLAIARYLDSNIRQLKFTLNQFETDIRDMLGTDIYGVSISGLGGDANYVSINVSDEHNRLCIGRKLIAQADASTIVDYSVNTVFKSY